jgi:hypothetical protein
VLVNGTDGTDIDSLIITAKVASGSMDVQVQDIDWLITCGGATYGLITGNLGTTDWAGGNTLKPESVNADYLNGDDYDADDELVAGTTFKFDINLDLDDTLDTVDDGVANANVAGAGACAESAGTGETLEMKMVVDGGGTTILELQIESVTSGKEVT